jgi:adenine-specific DNA-methyltransferase
MIDFKSTYSRDEILDFLKNSFIKDFQKDVRIVDVPEQKYIQEAHSLGYSSELELSVFEFLHEGGTEKRVTLTKEAFNVLRDSGSFKAIGIFYSKDTDDWRFSLMTATPVVNEKGKVKTVLSNPKRYSFLLGPNAKVNTPTKFLITKGEIQNFEDLKERFSIEVVNKEFYKEISKLFIQLVGGTLGKGKSKEEYTALLKLPGVKDSSQTAQEFAVRLIGRLIFCWFLREKKNGSEESLMPHSLLSLEASKNHKNYYHDVLEPIFFKVLNVPLSSRKDEKFSSDPYDKIPYLNGGLFSPHDDDFYSTNESKQQGNNEEVVVPDKWLQELFEILETYNFTIDENTAFDEELSIDPEMLGRIFENLLAEINPETGESARKSTGSYYTPRVIVDYMVDESLYLYLKNKTDIQEEKLRSLISYNLDDDTYTPLSEGEKEKIITAIDELKILDPACGSGAFPMGALQKIVFILQQLDPNGQYWFKAQIKNVPVELRKNLEREHSEKNFDYIRKLGVIRRNIFGVDIQPIATEISRLRCFLTLIVDQKVDDNKENRGIDPLPNLDFKFVTANSLISLPEKENHKETIGMFEDSDRINELKDIRDQFFNASNFERIELKDQFRKIQLEMSRYYNSVKNAGADLTEMLLSWDPFSHKMTAWFDPEWMFGINEGFDVIIGNPPWISNDSIDIEQKEFYKKFYKTASGRFDIAGVFVEMATRVAGNGGVIFFVLPEHMWIGDYFRPFREYVDENLSPIEIISLKETAFSQVANPSSIFLATKMIYKDPTKKSFFLGTFYNENRPEKFVSNQGVISRIIFDPFVQELNSNLRDKNVNRLEEIAYVSDGIQTANLLKTIFTENPEDESKYHKALRRGKDIESRYSKIIWKGLWVLKPEYTRQYKRPGFSYDSPKRMKCFEAKEKIILRQTEPTILATLDCDGYFFPNSIFQIALKYNDKEKIRCLLGILNSSLIRYLYLKISQVEGTTKPQLYINILKNLPVSFFEIYKISGLVDEILSIKSDHGYEEKSVNIKEIKKKEYLIDKLVYDFYKIKPEDSAKITKYLEEQFP